MSGNTFLAAAEWYASRWGWRILPLKPKEKTPLLGDWVRRASTDPQQLREWWAKWPDANLGVACGQASGLWVLDVDPRHDGDTSLGVLLHKHGPLPPSVCQRTGGGGDQYFWRWPPSRPVRNRTGVRDGLDVRGEGGYVVLPPSVHPSGGIYQWDLAPHEQELVDAPAWLLDLVVEQVGAPKAPPADLTEAPIPEGNRNRTLFSRACRLRRAGAGESVILADLVEVNRARCRPPLEDKELAVIAHQAAAYPVGRGNRGPEGDSAAAAQARPTGPGGTGAVGQTSASSASTAPGPHDGTGPKIAHLFPLNESGNAQRFLSRYGRDARYCHTWGCWMLWTGTHWERDGSRQVERWMAEAISTSIDEELGRCEDDQVAKELRAWKKKNLNDRPLQNSCRRAEAIAEICTEAKDYDSDQVKFCVANGTINLRTGELLPHDRADLITRLCEVRYQPDASDDRWNRYLLELTGNNDEQVSFLARAAGYSMSGETKRQVVFMMAGPGGTGKSTFTATIQAIIGSYAYSLPFETFLADRGNGKKWSLANCSQMRLVVCEESGEARRFSSDVVKLVTGGTPVEAEAKFGQPFSFIPRFKVWFVTNEPPWVSDTDTGFWRRMRLIRCDHLPQTPDPDLPHHLTHNQAAQEAVLAWMVRGAIDYFAGGLQEPFAVVAASMVYRQEQDPIRDWLEEETVWGETETVSRSDLRKSYEAWARENAGGKTISAKGFYERLRARGADDAWLRGTTGRPSRAMRGLRLRRDDGDEEANVPPPTFGRRSATGTAPATPDSVDTRPLGLGSDTGVAGKNLLERLHNPSSATGLPQVQLPDGVDKRPRTDSGLDRLSTQSQDPHASRACKDPSSAPYAGKEGSTCDPVAGGAPPGPRRPSIFDPPDPSEETIFGPDRPLREPGADEDEPFIDPDPPPSPGVPP